MNRTFALALALSACATGPRAPKLQPQPTQEQRVARFCQAYQDRLTRLLEEPRTQCDKRLLRNTSRMASAFCASIETERLATLQQTVVAYNDQCSNPEIFLPATISEDDADAVELCDRAITATIDEVERTTPTCRFNRFLDEAYGRARKLCSTSAVQKNDLEMPALLAGAYDAYIATEKFCGHRPEEH